MATSAEENEQQNQNPKTLNEPINNENEMEIEEDEDYEEEEEEEVKPMSKESRLRAERDNLSALVNRLKKEKVSLRVHDLIIKGNTKTKDSVIEAEIEEILKEANSMQGLIQAAGIANARLRNLEIFESVDITLDSGPSELPGTANVVVNIVETKNPLTGDLGIFTKPEARSWSLEGSLKLKNLLGYADIWDGSVAYGWDQASEISAGIALPRFRGLKNPVTARAMLLSQDWLKFSSYKERMMGISLGLISTRNHNLAYNLTWRNLTDPTQMCSKSIRGQLGHSLLSALKYTFKIDMRDSPLRPTRGYAFASTSHIGGLSPDSRSLRFLRQDFDFRYAIPLGFCKSALNFGVSAGLIFPWGSGFRNMASPLPERYYMGGHTSPVSTLAGTTTLLGFRTRGLGPSEQRRVIVEKTEGETTADAPGRDIIGGDLAVTAFADLSFDLPLKLFRDAGIHGHIFACTGSLNKLTENEYKNLSFQKFKDSFRSSAGVGVIIPTKLLRVEVNYCYILKQLEHDHGKTGVQFSFSSPI
ncbi:hypothetical protein C5167_025408 [Papaver somniferum]|uniref:Bacterial surface antigen (D15) domain-containing protein n=1 Tax=Papaver somniferum TaxID=3469 RepID=A0A4Y7JRE1_PAPSO|nr:SAM50-like protein SPAC17C9.06 [Papaver somniferum]RZC63653.1 hypothetical protein C5167_025408 [Papaver somniferum]